MFITSVWRRLTSLLDKAYENVIITGADGFVGSYTVKYFIENSCKVLALDMSEAPRRLTVGEI